MLVTITGTREAKETLSQFQKQCFATEALLKTFRQELTEKIQIRSAPPPTRKLMNFKEKSNKNDLSLGSGSREGSRGAIRKGETNRRPWRRLKTGAMQIFTLCVYTVEGEPPERCLICGALRSKFKTF